MSPKHPKVSVVVLTNNRPLLLTRALTSLSHQSALPDEVLVIDNTLHSHETDTIAESFSDTLHISVIHSPGSIAAARNTGYVRALGDIVVYLDDDCTADSEYIAKFRNHFTTRRRLTAIIGRIVNALPENPVASVQFAYYRRGLREFVPNDDRLHPLPDAVLFDAEVSSFRKSKLSRYGFTDRHPRYRNDDTELGFRMIRGNEPVYIDQTITAKAYPKTSLHTLWDAAFWNGYSDAIMHRQFHTHGRMDPPYRIPFVPWIFREIGSKTRFSPWQKLRYGLLLISFPIVSRIGFMAGYII